MAEFIAAKDLPTTEATEVDVLCVDNGELKLKAGASIGGSTGGGGYVIRVKAEELIEDDEAGHIVIISNESYDNYAEILYNGGSVWVDLAAVFGALGMSSFYANVASWYIAQMDGAAGMMLSGFIMIEANAMPFVLISTNGTWRPPVA